MSEMAKYVTLALSGGGGAGMVAPIMAVRGTNRLRVSSGGGSEYQSLLVDEFV